MSNIQSTWLSRKLKASVQSKVTNFLKLIHCRACFNNNTILKRFYSETMINDREVLQDELVTVTVKKSNNVFS